MREADRAYIAGFFDGEGCISSSMKGGKRYMLQVTISQRSRLVLNHIQDLLGYGKIYTNARGVSILRIQGANNIASFIRVIYPYSIVKKPQLRVGYQLLKLPANARDPHHLKLKELKH